MLTKIGRATFKCKQCGHKFEAFETEGGLRAGINLPACPKCGSRETKKAELTDVFHRMSHMFNLSTTAAKTLLFTFFIFSIPAISIAQKRINIQDENVIAQMNYCINTLTNIIHNKSMTVLEHESDQLVNNLTMEQIAGLYDIRDFRIELLDAISKFEINDEERMLIRRIQSMKRDNVKWAALSNALNPTMLITGGGNLGPQAAFQALVTAARSVVEYKVAQNEQNIEELQAMWNLRKEDLETTKNIRKEAIKIVFNLYTQHHLNEKDRLTETTASLFNTLITEPDAAKRIRLLEDNKTTFERLSDFYYYLGMAYADLGLFDKAKYNFFIYNKLYQNAPILRYDEKSGCIALMMLIHDKSLSDSEKQVQIETALKNMPNNSAAVLQCALTYIYELEDVPKGLELIRSGIDNPLGNDKELLYMAGVKLLPYASKFTTPYSEICKIFDESPKMFIGSYLSYQSYTKQNAWPEIVKTISFGNVTKRRWYQLWIGKYFNENFDILLSERVICQNSDLNLYIENHDEDDVYIKRLQTKYKNGITLNDINDIDCLKENPDLKYLFFDAIIPNEIYAVKKDLNYDKIKNGDLHRLSEFNTTDNDRQEIIDFCKKHLNENSNTEFTCYEWDGHEEIIDTIHGAIIHYNGDSLSYKPHHTPHQKGIYVRILLPGTINLLYYYDSKNKVLNPYMYEANGKMHFAKPEYQKEFTDYTPIPQEDSWLNKIWVKIKSFFSNGDKNKESGNSKENLLEETISSNENTKSKEISWYNQLWGKITGLWNDKENSKRENESSQSQEEDDSESWMEKAWSSVKGIFGKNKETP